MAKLTNFRGFTYKLKESDKVDSRMIQQIIDALARSDKEHKFMYSNLDSQNITSLNTSITTITGGDGVTVLDGGTIKMYDDADTLRFYVGFDGADFQWSLYNELGAETVGIDSNGNATFSGDISASDISGSTITGSTLEAGTTTKVQITSGGAIDFIYSGSTKGQIYADGDGFQIDAGAYMVVTSAFTYYSGQLVAGNYINSTGAMYCDSGQNPPLATDRVRNVTYNDSRYCLVSDNYATESWVLGKDYATELWVTSKGYVDGSGSAGRLAYWSDGDTITSNSAYTTTTIVTLTGTQTLTNKTLSGATLNQNPSIGSQEWINANHSHSSGLTGGTINFADLDNVPSTRYTGTIGISDTSGNLLCDITVSNGIITGKTEYY